MDDCMRSLVLCVTILALVANVATAGFCDDRFGNSDGFFGSDITGNHCDGERRSVYCACEYETEYKSGRRRAEDEESTLVYEDDEDMPIKNSELRTQKRSRSRRSRRSGHYETKYECEKKFETNCGTLGCNENTQACNDASTVCGTTYASSTTFNAECPRDSAILPAQVLNRNRSFFNDRRWSYGV